MKQYEIHPNQINFEITETSAMTTNAAVSLNINSFVDNGIDLSLDDYGTGYSNISYLYHLPFSIIKIDKSILWSADKNAKANITLANIFNMAKKLDMHIVVEGVETEEQIKKLISLKCDYFQGYYFSKPIPGEAFVKYIDEFVLPEVCM
jgi:EAL domain-containing protein (putative c-di-GMP-specific phosphodiesterase class I)